MARGLGTCVQDPIDNIPAVVVTVWESCTSGAYRYFYPKTFTIYSDSLCPNILFHKKEKTYIWDHHLIFKDVIFSVLRMNKFILYMDILYIITFVIPETCLKQHLFLMFIHTTLSLQHIFSYKLRINMPFCHLVSVFQIQFFLHILTWLLMMKEQWQWFSGMNSLTGRSEIKWITHQGGIRGVRVERFCSK